MNLLKYSSLPAWVRNTPLPTGHMLEIMRGNKVQDTIKLGPNKVHAFITHADGSITDLGISENLLCTKGRDLIADSMGKPISADNVATATSATSLTDSGESWTTDEHKGNTVFADDATMGLGFGNISSNTGTVLTIDNWQTADAVAATDPGGTPDYIIIPTSRAKYMAITADASAASAGNVVLTSEQTTNGLGRALATFAFSDGAATLTLTVTYTVTGTVANLHRIGLFTGLTSGVMIFEAVLNADADVINGDTLTVTDTVTLS